jgi:hypothetical protein
MEQEPHKERIGFTLCVPFRDEATPGSKTGKGLEPPPAASGRPFFSPNDQPAHTAADGDDHQQAGSAQEEGDLAWRRERIPFLDNPDR